MDMPLTASVVDGLERANTARQRQRPAIDGWQGGAVAPSRKENRGHAKRASDASC